MNTAQKKILATLAFLFSATVVLSAATGLLFGAESTVAVAKLLLAGIGLVLILWFLWRLAKALLWRVGRRLAISYFLIGVVPIPMVLLLGGLTAYLGAGFFLGHLHRDAVHSLERQLESTAEWALRNGRTKLPQQGYSAGMQLSVYSGGRRIAGPDVLPRDWSPPLDDWFFPDDRTADAPWLLIEPDGKVGLAMAKRSGRRTVVASWREDLAAEMRRRSGLWVDLFRPAESQESSKLSLRVGDRVFALQPATGTDPEARTAFFHSDTDDKPGLLDRPWLSWREDFTALHVPGNGEPTDDYAIAFLRTTPRQLAAHLFSQSAEFDAAVWASLLSVTGLLAMVYGAALAMALFMIFTLSRAINRLSSATNALRSGDFSTRIPVRRKDQIGELQSSFNQMAENLETLISTAAQKEILENELAIARDLQQSLLPDVLPEFAAIDLATLFRPSAAIGGDYYDVFPLGEERFAVVIADVSGHGLPTGLRMAMLKAALSILMQDRHDTDEMLRRLSALIRADKEDRFFATATVGVVDLTADALHLTNAGHPPTYLIRGGEAREILLPGDPLGLLKDSYGHATVELLPGDFLVWLSDGLIEANGIGGEPFGYDRLRSALADHFATADEVRMRLIEKVEQHLQGRRAEDDQTLLVLHYRPQRPADAQLKPRAE